MAYFNKKDKSKTAETGNSQNGNEASISRHSGGLKKGGPVQEK